MRPGSPGALTAGWRQVPAPEWNVAEAVPASFRSSPSIILTG